MRSSKYKVFNYSHYFQWLIDRLEDIFDISTGHHLEHDLHHNNLTQNPVKTLQTDFKQLVVYVMVPFIPTGSALKTHISINFTSMYYSLKVPASECSVQSHELLLEFVTDLYSWKHMYFPLNQRNIIRTQLYFAKNHLHSVRGGRETWRE